MKLNIIMLRTKYFLIFAIFLATLKIHSQRILHGAIFAYTNDKNIGKSCAKNLDSIKKWMSFVALKGNFVLELKEFKDEKFSYTYLEEFMKNVKISDSDAVIFYVSSHGYKSEQNDKFPRIVIPTGTAGTTGLYSTSKINNSLVAKCKNASAVITIVQACNKTKNSKPDLPEIKQPVIDNSADNVKKLLNSKKNIFVTSSQPGKTSYADLGSGSRFSRAFIFSFYDEIVSTDPKNMTWDLILKRSVKVNYSLHKWNQRDRYPVWEIKDL